VRATSWSRRINESKLAETTEVSFEGKRREAEAHRQAHRQAHRRQVGRQTGGRWALNEESTKHGRDQNMNPGDDIAYNVNKV
jgi:hypothetical protein